MLPPTPPAATGEDRLRTRLLTRDPSTVTKAVLQVKERRPGRAKALALLQSGS